jgi:uncharacterized protein YkwD
MSHCEVSSLGYVSRKLWILALATTWTACQPAPGAGDEDGDEVVDDRIQLAQSASCAKMPAGADARAQAAYDRVNAYRQALGLPCAAFVPSIASAAAAHCAYYTTNQRAESCIASPHREVQGCNDFHAERFGDRMRVAGYPGNPAYETMTYVGNGARAVDKWVDSVWHRIPLLSPWVQDLGYGSNGACDTMDFGWAAAGASSAPVMFPFDGQTKVPRSFDGRTESPVLPSPPQGWPSGYPIMVYASELTVASHQLVDASGASVPHVWITPDSATSQGLLRNEVVMYAHSPLQKGATYRVKIAGTQAGKAVALEWSFTTK